MIDRIATLDDREKLMLIDMIADSLSSDLADDFPSLSGMFDAVEENRSYVSVYPGPFHNNVNNWKEWRDYRDARLAKLLSSGEVIQPIPDARWMAQAGVR